MGNSNSCPSQRAATTPRGAQGCLLWPCSHLSPSQAQAAVTGMIQWSPGCFTQAGAVPCWQNCQWMELKLLPSSSEGRLPPTQVSQPTSECAKKPPTPELVHFGTGRRGCIPDHMEKRNCLMKFHTVKPKISTTSETLKLESMRFQTSLNRAPSSCKEQFTSPSVAWKKWLPPHLG